MNKDDKLAYKMLEKKVNILYEMVDKNHKLININNQKLELIYRHLFKKVK